MKVPLEWLREYVDWSLDDDALCERLTMVGLTVEGVDEIAGQKTLTLEVTSNRGDCLSMIGVAREIAALSEGTLRRPVVEVPEAGPPVEELTSVDIQALDLCPRYAARVVRGVTVQDSPQWMQDRLRAAGMRPINNVVDCTNYVALETGQPLHAFDFETLSERRIIVRRAEAGERITTLDEVERTLSEGMLVIADAERSVAVAGVMGGANTEVGQTTTSLLLESAHFAPASVRRTSKALGLTSEASRRFERWVDPNQTVAALDRLCALILETGGGRAATGVVDIYPDRIEPPTVEVRPTRVRRVLGVDIGADEMRALLERLGLQLAGDDPLQCTIPTHRNDIHQEQDLIEEVARLHGYDQIPETIPAGITGRPATSGRRRDETLARDVLIAAGLDEAVTFSLTAPPAIARANLPPEADCVRLRNPMTEEYVQLRTSLVPDMLAVLERNARHGVTELGLFELGRVYLPQTDNAQPVEQRRISLALSGPRYLSSWNLPRDMPAGDLYEAKGILEQLCARLRVTGLEWTSAEVLWSEAGCAAALAVAGATIGHVGLVSDAVREEYTLPAPVVLAELDFDALTSAPRTTVRYRPLPRQPVADRDLALVTPAAATCQQVRDSIIRHAGENLESVQLFDVYAGKQVAADAKSLAFRLEFRHPDRTLTDEEVDAAMERIVAGVAADCQAELRT